MSTNTTVVKLDSFIFSLRANKSSGRKAVQTAPINLSISIEESKLNVILGRFMQEVIRESLLASVEDESTITVADCEKFIGDAQDCFDRYIDELVSSDGATSVSLSDVVESIIIELCDVSNVDVNSNAVKTTRAMFNKYVKTQTLDDAPEVFRARVNHYKTLSASLNESISFLLSREKRAVGRKAKPVSELL